MPALFGPHGNSVSFYEDGNQHSYEAPKWLHEMGLDAYEYPGGNGIRASLESFKKIGENALKYNIKTSLHTPYYISLSSVEPEKRLKSIVYIRESVKAAEALNASIIVIHTGSASKITRSAAMTYARETIEKALEEIQTDVIFGLETMGKVNQLGTLDEVIELCKISPRLSPVVDFGHLNARDLGGVFETEDDYRRVFTKIGEALGDEKAKNLHCHFSKIEYTGAGEKKHLTFKDTVFGPDFEPLINVIIKDNLSPRIICESDGTMAEDALKMKKYYLQNGGL